VSESIISRFKTKTGGDYVTRNGRRIKVETLEPRTPARKKREPFAPTWVKYPAEWAKRLKGQRGAVHDLAHYILQRDFECRAKRFGEIILSTAATGIHRATRGKAVMTLIRLGLIEAEQCGNQTFKVTRLFFIPTPASPNRDAKQVSRLQTETQGPSSILSSSIGNNKEESTK
jgi:hypothetical protein